MSNKNRIIELEAGQELHVDHRLTVGTVSIYRVTLWIPEPLSSTYHATEGRYQVGNLETGYLSSDRHDTMESAWNAARAIDVQNIARYMEALSV